MEDVTSVERGVVSFFMMMVLIVLWLSNWFIIVKMFFGMVFMSLVLLVGVLKNDLFLVYQFWICLLSMFVSFGLWNNYA